VAGESAQDMRASGHAIDIVGRQVPAKVSFRLAL